MKAVWIVVKLLGFLVGGVVLLVVLFVAFRLLRPSIPYVWRGELESLAASGPYNNSTLASEICGTPVSLLGGLDPGSPGTALPQARILSWRPFYPMEGTASARVVGIGASSDMRTLTGRCEATITFKYSFMWSDNGRALVLEPSFVESPKVVSGTITRSK